MKNPASSFVEAEFRGLRATTLAKTPGSSLVVDPICDLVAYLGEQKKRDAGDGDQEWSRVGFATSYELFIRTVSKSNSDDEKKRCVKVLFHRHTVLYFW